MLFLFLNLNNILLSLTTFSPTEGVVITNNTTDTNTNCNNNNNMTIKQQALVGTPLLIGIALGSFALGIILTVLVVHCVTLNKKKCKQQQSTDLYRFENRSINNVYEPLKVYDVFPQGHPLNRTNAQSVPPSYPTSLA